MSGTRIGPWGDRPPKRPRAGAGREALAKRARGKPEARRSAEAARRGLRRTRSRRTTAPNPIRGAAAKLRTFGGLFEQSFLNRKRLRNLLLALAAVWAVSTFVLGDVGVPRWWSVSRKNAALTRQIEDLSAREHVLREQVEALTDAGDVKALERIAYEEHALVRQGEVLVRYYQKED